VFPIFNLKKRIDLRGAKVAENYKAERTISAVFKEQNQVDDVIRRLLDRGVSREHISVMGRNFQSETRIAGFISKKDVILGGLRTGAIFGSLFGSFLSLLSGVGVLFIPFVGPIVAAGPIGALLLGAASGAIAGSAGAGLVSVFTTLGMPEDKAAIESAGGEEINTIEATLARACPGECNNPEDLSPEIRAHLSQEAQGTFIEQYNTVLRETNDDTKAEHLAWEAVHQKYDEDENGVWSKSKVSV
jgi:cation transport regulator ChaB